MSVSKNKKAKKFYITTSIPYANAKPHIGHALEMVQSDAIARYFRGKGREVYFLTGTDEHGDKIYRAAIKSGETPKAFVNKTSKSFRDLKKILNLSWDGFIRTTDKEKHWPGAIKMFETLLKKGDIYKKAYRGLYCVGCEGFVTEKDLVDGLCPIHKKAPEIIEEENYFFRLSRYQKKLEALIESNKLSISPEGNRNEVLSFIRGGLEDVSFSRSKKNVSWGIPIKNSDQVMYVWCDALTNYISAIGYGRDEKNFAKWWPADLQVVGKDISRFHAMIWPAMLLSAGLKTPKKLFVHGFITIDGQKISKSIGNVIDPKEAADKLGIDPLRYYMLYEIPSDNDGDFSYEKLETRYTDDLAKGLGNFASRILSLCDDFKISEESRVSVSVKNEIKRAEKRIEKHIGEFRLHDAISAVFDLIGFGDAYINEHKPWQNKNERVLRDMIALLDAVAQNIAPFLPDTYLKIIKALNNKSGIYRPKKINPLFPRIEK